VKVHAAAVHPPDTVARAGWLGPMVPAGPTYVLGVDAAGAIGGFAVELARHQGLRGASASWSSAITCRSRCASSSTR
jgi:NADPH:quinone reductase-like Zn-dependent oxidoreductase